MCLHKPFFFWELFRWSIQWCFFSFLFLQFLLSWGHLTHKSDTHSPAPVTSAHILLLSFFSNHLMQQKVWSINFHLPLWQCYPHDNRLTVTTTVVTSLPTSPRKDFYSTQEHTTSSTSTHVK